jgi:integrase
VAGRYAPGIERRGKRYTIRYRDADGAQHRESFRTYEEARDAKRRRDQSVRDGSFVDPADHRLTVKAFGEDWRDRQLWRPRTRQRNATALDVHIYPAFGSLRIAAVRPSQVQAWVTRLADTHKPGTVRQIYGTFASLMKAALADQIIVRSPCLGIKLPEALHHERAVVLSQRQVEAIAAATPERYRAAVWLGALAGLRLGEALGVTRDRIDFDAGVIRIDRQWLADGSFGAPKTRRSVRTVPMPRQLARILAEHLLRWGENPEGGIFTGERGRQVAHRHFHAVYNEVVAGLGLPERARTFHALRHHYASTLIAAGLNAKLVQAQLGHANIATTFDIYGHLFDSDAEGDRVRDAFASYEVGR